MIVSLEWLKDYTEVKVSPEEFCDRMIMSGSNLETMENVGVDMEKVVVGRIEKIEKHPDADKLVVCQLNVGAEELVQIVTGAKNVFEGAYVPVALDGAKVPGPLHGQPKVEGGVTIKAGQLRGVDSHGMLCSFGELGFEDKVVPVNQKDGIWILGGEYPLGMDFAEALELKDERNLLLDQLSSYIKLDVQYDPNYLKGGIAIEDVTISMVGADGTRQPLIYNGSYSIFNVQTEGTDGTNEAIITIDNSMLPADKAVNTINNLLNGVTYQNGLLQSIHKELASKPEMMKMLNDLTIPFETKTVENPVGSGNFVTENVPFDFDAADSKDLVKRLGQLIAARREKIDKPDDGTNNIGLDAQLKKIEEQIAKENETYEQAVADAKAAGGTVDEQTTNDYKDAIKALNAQKKAIQTEKDAVLKEISDLNAYLKATNEALDNLDVYDNALKKLLAEK